jgi:2-methylisocitrate lyase-like PEP mutase family enzyme
VAQIAVTDPAWVGEYLAEVTAMVERPAGARGPSRNGAARRYAWPDISTRGESAMNDTAKRAADFLALHQGDTPLLLANAWDVGSAKLLQWLGFEALATTSSGFAASLGRLDYSVSREEALAHAAALVQATAVPVSADFENGFGDQPAEVAETVRRAAQIGLAGCSIEDWDPAARRVYDLATATRRVAAAAEAAHAGRVRLVLTARAENYLRGNPDIEDTIARLRAFERAGADVLYAPALDRREDLRRLLEAVELPVNVLARRSAPPVSDLAELGVKRVSVGGSFALCAFGAAVGAARELLNDGTYGFAELSAQGAEALRAAFA